ncbi:glycosyltransferase family 39 protein [Candidatus Parcubacteria bacterium]|nr:glycosyltransferase family 39 protein [Candidatus Parcubacteria bacterium]MBI4099146.1 glycosyltransferase family 39 protein [Candidatus Parcubacteria bacterium]MBI4385380.1 glycosyltransferase family 39 protein [Candidatus Parcubacteria bacterium]
MRKHFAVAIVCVVSLIVFFVGLGAAPLFDYDEATYGDVAVKGALGRSPDPLTFWRYDSRDQLQPWFEKPPLALWLQSFSMALLGVSESAVRLPSALAGVGIAMLVYLIARRMGGWPAGLAGAAVALTTPFFVRWAREGRLDAPALFFMMLALWFWLDSDRARWKRYAFWAALGFGFLAKSAIVLLIPVTIGVYLLMWDRSGLKRMLSSLDTYLGAGVFAAVVLPWHIYEIMRYGQDFVSSYFGKHLIGRASANYFGDPRNPVYNRLFYVRFLWSFGQPWISVVLAGLVAAVFAPWRAALRQSQLFRIGIIGSALVLGVFTVLPSRLGTYLMPIVPFLALIAAACVGILWHTFARQTRLRLAVASAGAAVLMVAAVLLAGEISKPAGDFLDDEKAVGLALQGSAKAVYLYDWDFVESIMFYSQKGLQQVGELDAVADLADAALIMPSDAAKRLSLTAGDLVMTRRYEGPYLTLLEFSDSRSGER